MTFFIDEYAIDRVGCGLLDRTLPKAEWTHAGHFGAALWLLRHRPEMVERGEMSRLIRAYNDVTGVANTDSSGYHETITCASLRAARIFLDGYDTSIPVHHVANALMTSALGKPDWLLEFWSRSILFSVDARRFWCDADLKPFPY